MLLVMVMRLARLLAAAGAALVWLTTSAQAALDPCLVGTWRSESIENTFIAIRGGAGVMMSIKPDGALGIDYNSMDRLNHRRPILRARATNFTAAGPSR